MVSIGNTPLHLAFESGHGSTAVLLIEAGADRDKVSTLLISSLSLSLLAFLERS